MRPAPDIDSIDNRDEAWVRGFSRWVYPKLARYFRASIRGLDRVPEGAALIVGNHSGGFVSADMWLLGGALYLRGGLASVPFGLAHEIAVKLPGVHQVLPRLGAVRASPENASRLFERGDKVLVYPGGDVDAFRPTKYRDRILFGRRRGYVRLALRCGVPIVPVVSAGSHETWWVLTEGRALARLLGTHRWLRLDVVPITWSLPWGFMIGFPPVYIPLPTRILIEVLEPIAFERSGEEAASDAEYVEACHARVLSRMQSALDRLARERKQLKRSR